MLPFSLRNPIGTFWGAKLDMCVGKVKGGERWMGGVPYEFPRGCSAGTSFLDVSFLFFLLLWARSAGASCNFSSCVLDMFPSVSTYKVKGTCLLKPKVHGLAVAWLPSACGGLAGLCLPRFPPVSGSGCLSRPAEGLLDPESYLISFTLPCRVPYVLTLSLSER